MKHSTKGEDLTALVSPSLLQRCLDFNQFLSCFPKFKTFVEIYTLTCHLRQKGNHRAVCIHLCFFAPLETPSEPRSALVYFVNESSAVLTWLHPEITGTPINLSYDVNCQTSCQYFGSDCDDQKCNSGVDGQLTAEGLNTTIFTATNLAPFVNYTCKITAKNRVSKVATDSRRAFTYVNLTTNGSG